MQTIFFLACSINSSGRSIDQLPVVAALGRLALLLPHADTGRQMRSLGEVGKQHSCRGLLGCLLSVGKR